VQTASSSVCSNIGQTVTVEVASIPVNYFDCNKVKPLVAAVAGDDVPVKQPIWTDLKIDFAAGKAERLKEATRFLMQSFTGDFRRNNSSSVKCGEVGVNERKGEEVSHGDTDTSAVAACIDKFTVGAVSKTCVRVNTRDQSELSVTAPALINTGVYTGDTPTSSSAELLTPSLNTAAVGSDVDIVSKRHLLDSPPSTAIFEECENALDASAPPILDSRSSNSPILDSLSYAPPILDPLSSAPAILDSLSSAPSILDSYFERQKNQSSLQAVGCSYSPQLVSVRSPQEQQPRVSELTETVSVRSPQEQQPRVSELTETVSVRSPPQQHRDSASTESSVSIVSSLDINVEVDSIAASESDRENPAVSYSQATNNDRRFSAVAESQRCHVDAVTSPQLTSPSRCHVVEIHQVVFYGKYGSPPSQVCGQSDDIQELVKVNEQPPMRHDVAKKFQAVSSAQTVHTANNDTSLTRSQQFDQKISYPDSDHENANEMEDPINELNSVNELLRKLNSLNDDSPVSFVKDIPYQFTADKSSAINSSDVLVKSVEATRARLVLPNSPEFERIPPEGMDDSSRSGTVDVLSEFSYFTDLSTTHRSQRSGVNDLSTTHRSQRSGVNDLSTTHRSQRSGVTDLSTTHRSQRSGVTDLSTTHRSHRSGMSSFGVPQSTAVPSSHRFTEDRTRSSGQCGDDEESETSYFAVRYFSDVPDTSDAQNGASELIRDKLSTTSILSRSTSIRESLLDTNPNFDQVTDTNHTAESDQTIYRKYGVSFFENPSRFQDGLPKFNVTDCTPGYSAHTLVRSSLRSDDRGMSEGESTKLETSLTSTLSCTKSCLSSGGESGIDITSPAPPYLRDSIPQVGNTEQHRLVSMKTFSNLVSMDYEREPPPDIPTSVAPLGREGTGYKSTATFKVAPKTSSYFSVLSASLVKPISDDICKDQSMMYGSLDAHESGLAFNESSKTINKSSLVSIDENEPFNQLSTVSMDVDDDPLSLGHQSTRGDKSCVAASNNVSATSEVTFSTSLQPYVSTETKTTARDSLTGKVSRKRRSSCLLDHEEVVLLSTEEPQDNLVQVQQPVKSRLSQQRAAALVRRSITKQPYKSVAVTGGTSTAIRRYQVHSTLHQSSSARPEILRKYQSTKHTASVIRQSAVEVCVIDSR